MRLQSCNTQLPWHSMSFVGGQQGNPFQSVSLPSQAGVPRAPQKSDFSLRPISLGFEGQRLKIMTYNLENLIQGKKSTKSLEALSEVILRESPDILAVQEVDSLSTCYGFNAKYLEGQYPNIVLFPVSGDRNIAILAKDTVQVVETKSHFDPEIFTRDFLEATFETADGYQFTVFNAHFRSMRGGERETQAKRLQEAQAVAKILDQHLKDKPNARVMLLGDLNAKNTKRGEDVIDALVSRDKPKTSRFLTETTRKKGSQPTHNGTDREGVKYYDNQKLDYCFVNSLMRQDVKDAYVAGTMGDWPWSAASDHHPLVTVIETPDMIQPANAQMVQRAQTNEEQDMNLATIIAFPNPTKYYLDKLARAQRYHNRQQLDKSDETTERRNGSGDARSSKDTSKNTRPHRKVAGGWFA